MTASIDTKIGVSGVAEFKRNMIEATSSVKNLDSQLKLSEKQFKQTGDAEKYLQDKSKLLKKQMEEQNKVIQQANEALNNMKERKVPETSKAFQDMQRRVYEAQAELINMQMALKDTENGFTEAAGSADKLTSSVNGINKKISLDQVIGGIDKITSAMETAGKAAVNLGSQIWDNIMASAALADNTATAAMLLDMDVEDYQKYKGVFDTIGELTVKDWMTAKQKVQKAINNPSQEQTDLLSLLGINTHEMISGKYGVVQGAAREWEDVFWDIAEGLQDAVSNGRITQDLADTYAEAIFGKKQAYLKPLMQLGKEGFAAALEEQAAASKEAIEKDAALNDTIINLNNSFESLKMEVTSGLAPALTAAAETLDSLLKSVLEYLQTPEGRQALKDMETSVSGLFEDLGKIDPEDVVEGFTGVFNTVVDGLEWLVDHKKEAGNALIGIVATWGALKITGGALTVLQLVQGVMGLTGGATAAGQAGAAAGAAWGAKFADAVAAAAPWLIGLYTLLNPAETGNNDLFANGRLTPEGWADVYENPDSWIHETALEVGELFGDLGNILNDANAINAMARYRNGGTLEAMIAELQALGYVLKVAEELPVAETSGGGTLGRAEGPIIHKRRNGETVIDHLDDEGPLVLIDPVRPMDLAERMGPITKDARKQLQNIIEELNEEETAALFDPLVLPAEVEVPEDSAEKIAEDVGTVLIPGRVIVEDMSDEEMEALFGSHANGLWSVPWDGYPAILHKDEKVVPAREAASRNFSSNLYVESMYMNNGQDSDALAAKVAAENRRIMNGFGSNI